MSPRAWLVLDLVLKAALLALLAFSVFSGLERFEGKAMTGRALTYPLATIAVPAMWWPRFPRTRYPFDVDVLLVLPFLIDTAGNALDLYDSVEWWDDANHVVNWCILVLAFGALLRRLPVGPLAAAGLALGLGAVTHIIWELAEYVTFIRGNENELRTAYTDTLGDMALSLTGSAVAAAAVWMLLRREQARE